MALNKQTPGLKQFFLEKFEPGIKAGSIKSVLDMGSGLSANFIPLLEKFPNLIYVGLEPSAGAVAVAKRNLAQFPNARVYERNGYDPVTAEPEWGSFDLVLSLSVLEHIKQLELFIANSVAAAKSGAQIVHRWDLGHALYPSSPKESFQVFLGNHFPVVLPEDKFVRMLWPREVETLLEKSGARVEGRTYHQMLGHKKILKMLPDMPEELVREMGEWEFKISGHLGPLEERKRLELFPAVASWARKI